MTISLYYMARRSTPINECECTDIAAILQQFAVDSHIEEYDRTGEGYNWESFCVYDPIDPTEPDVVFEGATRLPDNSEAAVWEGLQHWCAALTEIRKVIPSADWHVHVDDHEIQWDDSIVAYDPS